MADEERRTDEAPQFTFSRAHGKFLASQIRRNECVKDGISLTPAYIFISQLLVQAPSLQIVSVDLLRASESVAVIAYSNLPAQGRKNHTLQPRL
jgi:hypothetical protein